jgi:ABC-type oligopeptide transport system substrate-binding subunit
VPRDAIAARRQDFDLLLYDYAWRDYTALGIFLGPGPRNLLGYADGDIAGLITEARQARDEAARSRLLLAAQERVLGEALWVPLVVREITVAVKAACVGGETEDPEGGLWWHGARTAGDG